MISFILTIQDEAKRTFLEELFDAHSDRMYHAALKILGNREDAEDALQDTFIKIYGTIEKFKALSGDDLILLIIIYTRNTARDILRRRNTAEKNRADIYFDDGERVHDIPDSSPTVEEIVISRETVRRTSDFIDALPEPQRDVIIMKYRLNLREREIANMLGISETAVSSRIGRAKESLRKKLAEDM